MLVFWLSVLVLFLVFMFCGLFVKDVWRVVEYKRSNGEFYYHVQSNSFWIVPFTWFEWSREFETKREAMDWIDEWLEEKLSEGTRQKYIRHPSDKAKTGGKDGSERGSE